MPTKAPQYRPQPARKRLPTHRRGYDRQWQKYSQWFRAQPENVLCRHCKAIGKTVAAAVVDHIVAVKSADDPLFWDADNHQPLCKSCHGRKTATSDGGFGG